MTNTSDTTVNTATDAPVTKSVTVRARPERADARQDDAVDLGDHVRVGGDDDVARPRRTQRIVDRMEIARFDVDQRQRHSMPLVEGMASALRGSISTAIRSARAKPLKMLSAM